MSSSAPTNFDFSRPPPGYPVQAARASKNYGTSSYSYSTTGANYYPPVPKSITSTTSYYPAVTNSQARYAPAPAPTYSQYQVPNITPNHSEAKRSRPRQDGAPPAYQSVPPMPSSVERTSQIDPMFFNLAPPPPPPEPHPASIAVPPAGYILGTPVYTFPTGIAAIGAGQYLTQHDGHFRLPQYHGEYGTGYPNRNGFNNRFYRKKHMPNEFDSERIRKTPLKKKKKPLSQNMPAKKDWTPEEARRAWDVERDFNKRHKSSSLIIKFPDVELNRDIVLKFHSEIESVHFQQPSTPRFCFVTLKGSSCAEQVMKDLSQIKFGDGYLTAEPKNNKEEDMVKGPEDIDPLTLYVGNLAQEVIVTVNAASLISTRRAMAKIKQCMEMVTVDDVVKAYPKNKRIDIGFAKKMKYTRYAFVCFRTVDDAIDAFQNTHATEMYNKSLIVRFRRLHGTVGLPGDPKPQNTQKQNDRESVDKNGSLQDIEKLETFKTKLSESDSFSDLLSDDYDFDEPSYSRALNSLFNEYDYRRILENPSRQQDFNSTRTDFNPRDSNSDVRIKGEPEDYDYDSFLPSPGPPRGEEYLHVPMVEVKQERMLQPPPICIKQERTDQPVDVKTEYLEEQRDAAIRYSSDDEDITDYPEDPFLSEL